MRSVLDIACSDTYHAAHTQLSSEREAMGNFLTRGGACHAEQDETLSHNREYNRCRIAAIASRSVGRGAILQGVKRRVATMGALDSNVCEPTAGYHWGTLHGRATWCR